MKMVVQTTRNAHITHAYLVSSVKQLPVQHCKETMIWPYVYIIQKKDRRARDGMVVEFTTTYVISPYHH